MGSVVRALGLALVACLALPALAEVARTITPVVLALFLIALLAAGVLR